MSKRIPKYESVHVNLRRRRGSASQSKCVGCCVKRAEQWAYDHRDPNEVTNDRGLVYSVNLDHYIPLCRTCHRRFDLLARRLLTGCDFIPKFVQPVQHHPMA